LGQMSAQRVTSLYDLMDSAYSSELIRQHSLALGHIATNTAHRIAVLCLPVQAECPCVLKSAQRLQSGSERTSRGKIDASRAKQHASPIKTNYAPDRAHSKRNVGEFCKWLL